VKKSLKTKTVAIVTIMKKYFSSLSLAGLVLAFVLPLMSLAPVSAATCKTASGETIKTSFLPCRNGTKSPIIDAMVAVINFMAVGVGIAVVGGIIWGGMRYASSNGDASKAKQGVTTIVNAVVGLLLFIFMYAFFNYLVPGGLFG
jgi:hypothetical protein